MEDKGKRERRIKALPVVLQDLQVAGIRYPREPESTIDLMLHWDQRLDQYMRKDRAETPPPLHVAEFDVLVEKEMIDDILHRRECMNCSFIMKKGEIGKKVVVRPERPSDWASKCGSRIPGSRGGAVGVVIHVNSR